MRAILFHKRNLEMNNYQNVLIALDYDHSAKKVAEAGFTLASSMGAKVTLMHAIADPIYYANTEYSPITGFTGFTILDPLIKLDTDGLKKATLEFLEKFKLNLGDETIETVVQEGEAAESILKVAGKVHADIIVMGSHSRKWLENILLGSVAESVLHQSKVPLFIVPVRKEV
jgi:nucleotide-binding universal stress UspA family protein